MANTMSNFFQFVRYEDGTTNKFMLIYIFIQVLIYLTVGMQKDLVRQNIEEEEEAVEEWKIKWEATADRILGHNTTAGKMRNVNYTSELS